MSIRNVDLVREGYGIRFPQCQQCHRCSPNNNFEDRSGSIYSFNVTGFSGSNVPLGTVEAEVVMNNRPAGWGTKIRLVIASIAGECGAYNAFHHPTRNRKSIIGYVSIP